MNLSTKQYEKAVKQLSDPHIKVLQTLYYSPNSSATAKELAFSLNYLGHPAANRQIGQIGKTISKILNFEPKEYSGKNGNQPAYFYLIGAYYQDTGWNMWKNLQKAMEQLNFVSKENAFAIERLSTETSQYEDSELLKDGKVIQVFVNRYERNQKARQACLRHFGDKCIVCNFEFKAIYGDVAKGYIHVHHKNQLADIKKEYLINPIEDLVPVCANCHSVLHLTKPALTIEALQKIIKKNSK